MAQFLPNASRMMSVTAFPDVHYTLKSVCWKRKVKKARKQCSGWRRYPRNTRFNETGAQESSPRRCFNEAGAGAPGTEVRMFAPSYNLTSFNEAGRAAPETALTVKHNSHGPPASMRPGPRGPGNDHHALDIFRIIGCFNEAWPRGPENLGKLNNSQHIFTASMSRGRAAPETPAPETGARSIRTASMRPGRRPRKHTHTF